MSFFDRPFIAKVMYAGCFPMAQQYDNFTLLLIKLHRERCVIDFPQLHVGKKTVRAAQHYSLSMNQAFSEVYDKCLAQHESFWIYPPLREVFQSLQERPFLLHTSNGVVTIRVHSVEVWNDATGELVAGELGFHVGAVYASLTGFYTESGAGTVQMVALGRLLASRNFAFWDLGMSMEYKTRLGAHTEARALFLSRFTAVRNRETPLELPQRVNAREIIQSGPLV